MAYNEILDYWETQTSSDPNEKIWTFEEVLDHRKSENGKYQVLIKWSTGEETWEPLSWMGRQDPITVARYAAENDLLNTTQWKRFRPQVSVSQRRFIRILSAYAGSTKGQRKMKFGVDIPRNYRDALELDRRNGNTLWQDAIAKELAQKMEGIELNPREAKFVPIGGGVKQASYSGMMMVWKKEISGISVKCSVISNGNEIRYFAVNGEDKTNLARREERK